VGNAVFVLSSGGLLHMLNGVVGTCFSSAMSRVQSARSGRIVRQEGQQRWMDT
jgi:hypothetical protein